jgi:nucleoside-diphosphate-sugar epimerase
MTKILITGSNGFIGANLLYRLLELGEDTHILIRDGSNLWRIEKALSRCTKHVVDLTNAELIKEKINTIKPEIIYHCSTYGVSHLQKDPQTMFKTNVIGSLNLFNATLGKDYVKHIVNIGTSLEYGQKTGVIMEEDCERPNTLYGISKLSQTHLASYFAKNFDLPITTLRIFTGYGKFEEPKHLIGDIILGILTKKPIKIHTYSAKRDFIYIDDVIEALIKTADNAPIRDIINIGTGREYSVKDIIEIASKFGRIRIINEPASDERTKGEGHANTNKSKNLLNWTSAYSIDEGLRKTFEWFAQNKIHYLKN